MPLKLLFVNNGHIKSGQRRSVLARNAESGWPFGGWRQNKCLEDPWQDHCKKTLIFWEIVVADGKIQPYIGGCVGLWFYLTCLGTNLESW